MTVAPPKLRILVVDDEPNRTAGTTAVSHRLAFSDLDEETREVYRGGRRVDLSPTEFSLCATCS